MCNILYDSVASCIQPVSWSQNSTVTMCMLLLCVACIVVTQYIAVICSCIANDTYHKCVHQQWVL